MRVLFRIFVLRQRATVVVVALLGLLSVPAVASAATPRAIANGDPGAKALARRPALIVYSGDGAAWLAGLGHSARHPAHLHWTTWNGRQARAWGGDWHNNCTPDCVDGTFTAYRANVHLYRPRELGGYRVFTRMTITYPSTPPPYPAYRSRTITMRADYDPTYDTFFWG